MSKTQVYKGTFEEIINLYGKKLARRQVNVYVDDSDNVQTDDHHFYETSTPEEWEIKLREWAASHHHSSTPLTDDATDRENIYKGRE